MRDLANALCALLALVCTTADAQAPAGQKRKTGEKGEAKFKKAERVADELTQQASQEGSKVWNQLRKGQK